MIDEGIVQAAALFLAIAAAPGVVAMVLFVRGLARRVDGLESLRLLDAAERGKLQRRVDELAYGVTVNDIRDLNYMAEDDVTIYPEQKLLIRKKGKYNETAAPGASSTTGTPGVGVTPVEMASTPLLAASFTPRVRTTRTPLPVMALPSPTDTPTPVESSGGATQSVGIAMIVLCAVGLAAFLLFGIKKG